MLREHPLRQNGRQGNSLHCQPGDWHANELSISPTSWFAVAASLLEFQFRRCNCCSDFTPPPLDSSPDRFESVGVNTSGLSLFLSAWVYLMVLVPPALWLMVVL
ncbi:hypothetical protein STEG23_016277 [Scotinomys teguina]